MKWPDLVKRPLPKPDKTISYGSDELQVVDIWRPESKSTKELVPAVIMIHGGCWQTEIAERDLMNWIADDLRNHGVGVWNIEYRGVDRNGGHPNTYHDVGTAADLFDLQAANYGFKTDTVIAIGHSAGGHLALWLGNRPALPSSSSIRGKSPIVIDLAISQGGLPDLQAGAARKGHPCGTAAPAAMSGPDLSQTSPPEMQSGKARQVLFHNTLDKIAPPEFARQYVSKVTAKGVDVLLMETPAEGHVELVAPDSKSWIRQRTLILQKFGIDRAE